ncbi:MAG: HEPN domain-containing protein [Prevotellaceae bacterium]|jgi:excinuclease UvrABC nuclease subunit|nr:HEPN domain-containing protein [Prevotellaceae bacterium]
MSYLLTKSELNLQAAQFLSDKNHYATVLHPVYYSCLQLMKYKINHSLNIDYKQQATEASRDYNGNSHAYLISKITKKIKENKGFRAANEFERDIKGLKELREQSDYENKSVVSQDVCERAIRTAKNLILTINKI